jgi:hypothetical protein
MGEPPRAIAGNEPSLGRRCPRPVPSVSPALVSRLSGEPGIYYPTGRRNYARVVPTDDVEVAADAMVAQRLGVKRVYALMPLGYPAPILEDFVLAAGNLDLEIAGRRFWGDGQNFERLAALVARSKADGVFLVGSSPELLQALRARLGPAVPVISSGFDPATARLAGRPPRE